MWTYVLLILISSMFCRPFCNMDYFSPLGDFSVVRYFIMFFNSFFYFFLFKCISLINGTILQTMPVVLKNFLWKFHGNIFRILLTGYRIFYSSSVSLYIFSSSVEFLSGTVLRNDKNGLIILLFSFQNHIRVRFVSKTS